MKKLLLISSCLILCFVVISCSSDSRHFGLVIIAPDFEVNGQGENIDSIGFWEAADASNTLMFVTAKGNSLVEIWKYPFINNEQEPLIHPTFANSQVNGIWLDQENDFLYIAIANPSSTISVFKCPDLEFVMKFNKEGADLRSEPNVTLIKQKDGKKLVYVSADDIVFIHDAETGEFLGEFKPTAGLETMVGDEFYQVLYIPDENDRTGIYVYKLDGFPSYKNGINVFADSSIMDEDGEGIILYKIFEQFEDSGEGFIVVADQRKTLTDFEFFDRKTWEHLGTLRIEGVSNTDGIASTQQALPDYPMGLLAVLNDDTSVVGVGWDRIFKALGIEID